MFIRLTVEVVEQEVEENRIWKDQSHRPSGVTTVVEEQLEAVQKRQAELTLVDREDKRSVKRDT